MGLSHYYQLFSQNNQVIFRFYLTGVQNQLAIDASTLLLPPSGSFGVTKKAKAARLGVSGPPLFLPVADALPGIPEVGYIG
jgi:hypothetical protein